VFADWLLKYLNKEQPIARVFIQGVFDGRHGPVDSWKKDTGGF
jgi:hypothetical protein